MDKQFIQHRPSYFSGFENEIYDVSNFEEVLEIPFVKNFSQGKGFHSYAVSVDTKPEYRMMLMAVYNWDDEYNGCTSHWVVGHLPGFIMYETKLSEYKDLIAGHKPNCWIRKNESCKDLLGLGRSTKSKMKILKELGWEREDMFNVNNHCDCGFNDLKKRYS